MIARASRDIIIIPSRVFWYLESHWKCAGVYTEAIYCGTMLVVKLFQSKSDEKFMQDHARSWPLQVYCDIGFGIKSDLLSRSECVSV